jgi:hypothetical protein
LVDGTAPAATSAPIDAGDGVPAYLGAVDSTGTDWTVGWTYGIHDGARGQPLWIETL